MGCLILPLLLFPWSCLLVSTCAAQHGVAYHQRLLPAHTLLKVRQPGQGGAADPEKRDLRAELLAAEAAHFAKKGKSTEPASGLPKPPKRELEAPHQHFMAAIVLEQVQSW